MACVGAGLAAQPSTPHFSLYLPPHFKGGDLPAPRGGHSTILGAGLRDQGEIAPGKSGRLTIDLILEGSAFGRRPLF